MPPSTTTHIKNPAFFTLTSPLPLVANDWGYPNQATFAITNAMTWTDANTGSWQHFSVTIDLTDPNAHTVGWAPSGWTYAAAGAGATFFETFTNYFTSAGVNMDNAGYFRIIGPQSWTTIGVQQVLDNFQVQSIPEPSAILALAAGLAGFLALRTRRRAN